MLDTPILLVVFNRPDTTRQVFEAIRQVRPRQLYVAADGPREGVDGDGALCSAARSVVAAVDWKCDVKTLFREENLGCGLGSSSAISWFFDNVEQGIILEDDCVPDPTFFRFCGELLEHYSAVPRIMQISGANFLGGAKRGDASYYFSRYPYSVGGWATWRRAWKHFDHEAIPEEYRRHIWDWQWPLSVEMNRGLAVTPNVNLVTNIGCGRIDATHTRANDDHYANVSRHPMLFPLMHPRTIKRMDRYTDYAPCRPEERTYWGAPFRFARSGLSRVMSNLGVAPREESRMIRRLSRMVPRKFKDYVRAELLVQADGFSDCLGHLDPNIKTIFDVGANVGDMTLRMLEVFPRATVYSFEPCSSTFEELRRRVEASPHRERVKLFEHGFFDAPGARMLHVTSHHGANSLLEITPGYHELNPHVKECGSEEIALVRLDDFVHDMGIGQIDLMKIDVEGAETEVIAGGRETLKSKVSTVFCEISFVRHPRERGKFIELFQLMHDCRFAPAEIYDVAHGKTDTVWSLAQFDCVFRRFDA